MKMSAKVICGGLMMVAFILLISSSSSADYDHEFEVHMWQYTSEDIDGLGQGENDIYFLLTIYDPNSNDELDSYTSNVINDANQGNFSEIVTLYVDAEYKEIKIKIEMWEEDTGTDDEIDIDSSETANGYASVTITFDFKTGEWTGDDEGNAAVHGDTQGNGDGDGDGSLTYTIRYIDSPEWFYDWYYEFEDKDGDGENDTIKINYDPDTGAEEMNITVAVWIYNETTDQWWNVWDVIWENHTIYGENPDWFEQTWTTNMTDNFSFDIYLYDEDMNDEDYFFIFDNISLKLPNWPPTVTIDSINPIIPEEGTSVNFIGNGSDPDGDPLIYSWDFGDGTGIISGLNLTEVNHTYIDQGIYVVTLTVEDTHNHLNETSTSVTILNVAPIIDNLILPTGNEGENLTFEVVASDPGDDILTYTWNFGDGTIRGPNYYLDSIEHTYDDDGSYVINITIKDDDGGNTTVIEEIVVSNADPYFYNETDWYGNEEGETLWFTAWASDIFNDEWHLNYTWNFGDGTESITTSDFQTTHKYVDDGTYTLTITVSDGDGGEAVNSSIVTIINVAPTLSVDYTFDYYEGSKVDIDITVNDWGINDVISITIDFGDGSSVMSHEVVGTMSQIWEPDFAYADQGTFTVTIIATDGDGASDTLTFEVNVENLAPSLSSLMIPPIGKAGESYSVSVETSDVPDDVVTVTWNFGDGSEVVIGNDATHTFKKSGTITIEVCASDEDGGEACTSVVVSITSEDEDNGIPNISVFSAVFTLTVIAIALKRRS